MSVVPASIRRNLHLLKGLWNRRVPGQLVVQFTDRCNARCPQCSMRVTQRFTRSTLAVDSVRRIIDSAVEKGFRVISFTGGEPLLYFDELVALIRYAGEAGIEYIRTGTNGFPFTGSDGPGFTDRVKRIAETLASTRLRNFWISIDSAAPEVHEAMRGFSGVIAGIEKALPVFHGFGIYPSANLGINRNVGGTKTSDPHAFPTPDDPLFPSIFRQAFREAFRGFYRFVTGLGFTMVNACYPMSIDEQDAGEGLAAVYAATSADRVVRFSAPEKVLLFGALLDTIPEFRSRVRIFTPRSSLHALARQYAGQGGKPYPCRGGVDFFFVNCQDGSTYPCGYRGEESLGDFRTLDLDALSWNTECRRCDWECFRDPSELFGPLLEGLHAPLALVRKTARDPHLFRLWIEDLAYFRTCDLFDGRKPPDYRRLSRF